MLLFYSDLNNSQTSRPSETILLRSILLTVPRRRCCEGRGNLHTHSWAPCHATAGGCSCTVLPASGSHNRSPETPKSVGTLTTLGAMISHELCYELLEKAATPTCGIQGGFTKSCEWPVRPTLRPGPSVLPLSSHMPGRLIPSSGSVPLLFPWLEVFCS